MPTLEQVTALKNAYEQQLQRPIRGKVNGNLEHVPGDVWWATYTVRNACIHYGDTGDMLGLMAYLTLASDRSIHSKDTLSDEALEVYRNARIELSGEK